MQPIEVMERMMSKTETASKRFENDKEQLLLLFCFGLC